MWLSSWLVASVLSVGCSVLKTGCHPGCSCCCCCPAAALLPLPCWSCSGCSGCRCPASSAAVPLPLPCCSATVLTCYHATLLLLPCCLPAALLLAYCCRAALLLPCCPAAVVVPYLCYLCCASQLLPLLRPPCCCLSVCHPGARECLHFRASVWARTSALPCARTAREPSEAGQQQPDLQTQLRGTRTVRTLTQCR